MNVKLIAALAAGLLSAPGFAAASILDFEGPTSFDPIGDFYSSLGVSFGLDGLALSNDELGPYYSHSPSPGTVFAPVGPDATMNVAGGFAGNISFAYSSKLASSVSLYSGLDGTGTLLGTLNLTANAQNGCTDSPLCFWSLASLDFTGIAKSLTFGGLANQAMFDDVTFSAPVPLPAAGWLMMSALGGLGAWARRKRAAA